MQELNLAEVSVIALAPQPGLRRTLRDLMLSVGLVNFHDFETLDRLRAALGEQTPDLIMLALDYERDPVCELIRDIRRARIAQNPYLVILTLTWNADHLTVNEAIVAGADDIITMPLSIGMLRDRIVNMIENRKEFVVTATYVGPDRRPSSRQVFGAEAGTTPVPNSLRYKATGDESAAAMPEAIRGTERRLAQQRIHQLAKRLSHLASDMKEHALHYPANPVRPESADELDGLLAQISVHAVFTNAVHLPDLAASMERMAAEIRQSYRLDTRVFELLELHGLAIRAALKEGGGGDAARLTTRALNEAAQFFAPGDRPHPLARRA